VAATRPTDAVQFEVTIQTCVNVRPGAADSAAMPIRPTATPPAIVETESTLQLEPVTLIDVLFIAVPAVTMIPTAPTAAAPATGPTDTLVLDTTTAVDAAFTDAPTRTAPMPPTTPGGGDPVVAVFKTTATFTWQESTMVVTDVTIGGGFTKTDPMPPTPVTAPCATPGHKTVERATTTTDALGTSTLVAAVVTIPTPPTKRSGAATVKFAAATAASKTVTLDVATADCALTPTPPTRTALEEVPAMPMEAIVARV
jgi:hypothetical protein